MRIVNLIEDTQGTAGCLFEHGLSFYVESGEHRLLLDFGASDKTIINSEKLGIDLSKVDIAMLSHGHYDHSGGLLAFTQINPHAKIYVQKTACKAYYGYRDGERNYIGVDPEIAKCPQIVWVEEHLKVDDQVELFAGITGRKLFARGNLKMTRRENDIFVSDDFSHEQCIVVHEGEKSMLFSGCAHNGILNILDQYHNYWKKDPTIAIGGFHMWQNSGYTKEDLENVKEVAAALKKTDTIYFTGHCTGEVPMEILKQILGDQVVELHSGIEFTL